MSSSLEAPGSAQTTTEALDFSDLLPPSRVLCGARLGSKKSVLEQLATLLTKSEGNLSPHGALEALFARERLGSTGLGRGIALPHARLDGCRCMLGAFLHLALPLEYDAPDQRPVDLIFALLLPEEEHPAQARTLAEIAGRLHSDSLCAALRQAALRKPDQVHALLVQPPA